MRLPTGTPKCVVCFLSGTLPAAALLHLRQLSLFGMVARMPNNILHRIGRNILISGKPSHKYWFFQIRELCLKYALPQPLSLLEYPPQKEAFKNLTKKKIISYWEVKLRSEATQLSSLTLFQAQYMSLATPHPLWVTAGSSPYEVTKAEVQAKMLSGHTSCNHISCNHARCNAI